MQRALIRMYKQKRGRPTPPFLAGNEVSASCRPSSFRPLQPSLPCVYPSLRVGFDREEHSPYRSASADRHSAVRPYAARRFVLGRGLRPPHSPTPLWWRTRFRAFARSGELLPKKIGGAKLPLTPPGPVGGLSASFRPFSCRPLRSSSPLVPPWNVAAQLLPVTRGYNRWAERSTLILGVDYG